ncbi:putative ph-response regulator protein pali rim9 [Erysiphe necator]|uniref:Putative ph-response regulator protein pali rim9 n=1 Tax=Uncinula necator TaxID=52586 RepID=A0A0B1P3T7_UNCNE|nr:putative ph-response regulator protein pali rim9 [Erysiphe necator]
MLRPATPLTVLLLGAFSLLILSIISTPIVRTFPLASFAGIDFGVFGFCKADTCSPIEIGYDTSNLLNDTQSSTFDLPSSARATLSTILVVHPIAAFLTLIMLILAASAHFHTPSHSPRYLLIIFILSILTLVAALLSFLIDILLFVPHMAWGSYLVLAATILVGISGIISCAMRRTLVSRKARQRRINKNAEMNGDNFYSQLGLNTNLPSTGTVATSGNFAAFDTPKKEKIIDMRNDEQLPLTQSRNNENPINGRLPNETMRIDSPQGMGNLKITDPNRPAMPPQSEGHFDSSRQNIPPTSLNRSEPTLPTQDWQGENITFTNNMRGGYRGGRGTFGPSMRGYGTQRGGPQMGGFGTQRGGPQMGGFGTQRGGPQMGGFGTQRGGPGSLSRPRGDYQGSPGLFPITKDIQSGGGDMLNYDAQPPNFGYDNSFPPDNYETMPLPSIDSNQNPRIPVPPTGYVAYNSESISIPLPVAESPPPLFAEFEALSDNELNNYSNNESRPIIQKPWELSQPTNYKQDHLNPVDSSSIPAPLSIKPTEIVLKEEPMPLENNEILDDFIAGPRSPTNSLSSEFTSISQRGINPNWRDESRNQSPLKTMFHQKIEKQNQQDILFQGNPDFTIPMGRGGRGMPRGRGLMRADRMALG